MVNYLPTIPWSIVLFLVSVAVSSKKHTWSPTSEWTRCSKQCGLGEERQLYECVKLTPYDTIESAVHEKCADKKLPAKIRSCSMGFCPTNSVGSFIWVVGNWSQCPKNCGGSALQNREVSCQLKTGDGVLYVSKLSKCDSKIEPHRFISCANTDCPPKFLSSKWGKCPKAFNCGKSVRRRIVKCVTVLRSTKHKVIKPAYCYRMHLRPPSTWSTCTPDHDKNCQNVTDLNRFAKMEAKIEKDESEIYQMRSSKRMRLTVGQTAYVFTYTKISVLCPAEGFPQSLIKWSNKGHMYEYNGKSSKRVSVNRKGILIIKEFMLSDRGVWKCHAGTSTASVVINHELPSNGFHNWLKRHSNSNYGMFNEESKATFIIPDSLIWMKSDWSKCSVTCGGDEEESGFQVRKVACEKVDAKYYKIIDDKYCSNEKPISKRRCKSTLSCPLWRIEKEPNERCTDQCINTGVARMNTNIYCEYETRTVDSSFCDQSKRPNITCPNSKCTLSYLYGPWSQCSLSCSNSTNVSIRSRTMQCIWSHDKESAYHLCQQNHVYHEALTKLCRVPKCILGCRDLSSGCRSQSKYRCRSSLFYHFCCAFCRLQNLY